MVFSTKRFDSFGVVLEGKRRNVSVFGMGGGDFVWVCVCVCVSGIGDPERDDDDSEEESRVFEQVDVEDEDWFRGRVPFDRLCGNP